MMTSEVAAPDAPSLIASLDVRTQTTDAKSIKMTLDRRYDAGAVDFG